MPSKIVQLGPWRRDGNYYDMSGQGNFVLSARNVTPVSGGYTGPPHFATFADVLLGATPYSANGDEVDMALVVGTDIFASVNANGGDLLLRLIGSTWEDAEGATAWTSNPSTGSLFQYGDFVVACNENQVPQYIDSTSATGTNFSDLIVTTAPSGSSFATAVFKAAYGCAYRNHVVFANLTMTAAYPSSNTIYTNGKNYGSLVWISMDDNIRRFASPAVHPEVKGSIPLDLNDSPGAITGLIGGEDVYVFKSDAVYRIVGPPWDAIKISDGIGTISPKSIIRVKGIVYFVSNHGPAAISGNTVEVLVPDGFINTLTSERYDEEAIRGWRGPDSSVRMLANLVQTNSQMKRIRAMYSDSLGCVIWFLRSGRYIAMRVDGSAAMSMGFTGDFFPGTDDVFEITAVARYPDWPSSTFSDRNIVFRPADGASLNVAYASEDYSGFEGRIVPPNGAFQFTTPMMPYAIDENGGVLPTRITGFRIIGECHRAVRNALVRTNVDWHTEPLIRERSGDRLQSRDGWISTPNTYAGRYHSLSFLIHDSVEETVYFRRPFFSALEVGYEVVPMRGA